MRHATAIRSCVGCGARAPQRELVRMTLPAGTLQLDDVRRAPGRGAYLHRERSCWTAFVGRRGPVRSLRSPVLRAMRQAIVDRLDAIKGREED